MQCRQCGCVLTQAGNYCPACGMKLSDEEKAALSAVKHPVRKLRVVLWTLLAGLIVAGCFVLFSRDATDTVREQLKAIKDNRLNEAYHNYTSKSFQEAISFEKFGEFLKSYPALADSRSVRFIDRKVVDNTGELQALVETTDGREIPVHYKMAYEGDEWKIQSIKVERQVHGAAEQGPSATGTHQAVPAFDSKPLADAVNEVMNEIRSGDISKAYDNTSKDFKKISPFKEFDEFVKEQHGFYDNATVEIGELSFDNNIATLGARLKTKDGQTANVEFDLIYEDGSWKVLHLIVLNESGAQGGGIGSEPTDDGMKFKQFILGAAADSEGRITEASESFNTTSGDIYLNLYVADAKPGSKVKVTLEHVDSASRIDPVVTEIPDGGEAILTFIFSPPKSGWPEGIYRLFATSSTGSASSFDFKVKGQ